MFNVHFATPESAGSVRATAESHGPIASPEALFSKLAQALELPDYFGHNWDALDECLRDLDGDVVLLVYDAAVLWREAPEVAAELVDVWLAAAEERSSGEFQLVFVW
jgi:RNAse (barnase) inhibitor barstar